MGVAAAQVSLSFGLGVAIGLGIASLVSLSKRCKKRPAPRRYGGAIKLKRDMFARYTQLHDAVWEDVLTRMSKSNIRNFTIYYHNETSTMFSHFEWIGHWRHQSLTAAAEKELFDTDMKAIADDPVTKIWWTECEPCQDPFSQWPRDAPFPSQGGSGDWWAPLVCLNHCGHWATEYTTSLRDPDFVPQNPHGMTTAQPTRVDSSDSGS